MLLDKKDSRDVYLSSCMINGKQYRQIQYYLDRIDWEALCETPIATKLFHGDLQFDNIVCTENDSFKLIDWRGTFGNQHTFGDVYYDLAKLYGGICMNYSHMKSSDNYSFLRVDNEINYSFRVDEGSISLREGFRDWAELNKFSFDKIKKLVALVYLNMSPLHDDGLDDLLFFHAITLLDEACV